MVRSTTISNLAPARYPVMTDKKQSSFLASAIRSGTSAQSMAFRGLRDGFSTQVVNFTITLFFVEAFYQSTDGSMAKLSIGSSEPENYDVKFTQDELKARLTPMQYHCTQEKGTERAFTGEYVELKDDGNFHCVVCGNLLFKSTHKFDSGSGWPSFSDMAAQGTVKSKEDFSHGMVRTEVVCAKCGAHLGHVFNDGPKSTGLRYCINSACLKFKGEDKPKAEL